MNKVDVIVTVNCREVFSMFDCVLDELTSLDNGLYLEYHKEYNGYSTDGTFKIKLKGDNDMLTVSVTQKKD